MKAGVAALSALVAAGALGACGSGDSGTETETVVRTVREPPPTTTTPPPRRTKDVRRSKAQPVTRPRRRTVDMDSFNTPSGNVGCVITADSARCDIGQRDWAPPPAPASCELDWGQGLSVAANGAADFVCAGDTALDPQRRVLAYGDDAQVGPFTCASREAGVTCRNRGTGTGFFISRERYDLF